MDLIEDVLSLYFERADFCIVIPINTGLINSTYLINLGVNQFILQAINTTIFPEPEHIISNMLILSRFLKEKDYPKHTLNVRTNRNGFYLTFSNGKVWRMTDFIPNSKAFNQVNSKKQAYEAAKAISEFHYYLKDFSVERISPGIKDFLAFEKRVLAFNLAIQNGNINRIKKSEASINYLNSQVYLIDEYLAINFPKRIVHADAKIGNFLFDLNDENKVLALIDWDTITVGNVLCDFGDMVRTYANVKKEDDPSPADLFSAENYEAIKEGFFYHLKNILSDVELQAVDLTAQVVVLIQAIRFLTDYLNDDIYYSISYESHNLDRTTNQINFIKELNNYLCTN